MWTKNNATPWTMGWALGAVGLLYASTLTAEPAADVRAEIFDISQAAKVAWAKAPDQEHWQCRTTTRKHSDDQNTLVRVADGSDHVPLGLLVPSGDMVEELCLKKGPELAGITGFSILRDTGGKEFQVSFESMGSWVNMTLLDLGFPESQYRGTFDREVDSTAHALGQLEDVLNLDPGRLSVRGRGSQRVVVMAAKDELGSETVDDTEVFYFDSDGHLARRDIRVSNASELSGTVESLRHSPVRYSQAMPAHLLPHLGNALRTIDRLGTRLTVPVSSNTIPYYGYVNGSRAMARVTSLHVPLTNKGECQIQSYTSPATHLNIIGWTWWQCDVYSGNSLINSRNLAGQIKSGGGSSLSSSSRWPRAFSNSGRSLKTHGVHDFNHHGASSWQPYNQTTLD